MFRVKITEGNPESKHRHQLIRDMIYVCCLPHLSDKSRREFLDKAVSWPFSDKSQNNIEKSAKYKGCAYWSKNAWEYFKQTGNAKNGLRHEHVVPRCVFIEAMESYFESKREDIKKEKVTLNELFTELYEHMDNKMLGCVVTKEEAILIDGGKGDKAKYKKCMPEEAYDKKPISKTDEFFNIKNPWARYTRLEDRITIYHINWTENSKRGWEDGEPDNYNVLNSK